MPSPPGETSSSVPESEKLGHEPTITPLFDTVDKMSIIGYDITSPSGLQKFRVTPDDPMFKRYTDQLISNMEDGEEDLQPIQVAARYVQTLRGMGVAEKDLPKTDIQALSQLESLTQKYLDIQTMASQIVLHKAYQESFQETGWQFLLKSGPAKHSIEAIHGTMTVLAAQKMGVNTGSVETSKQILAIQTNMSLSARMNVMVKTWVEGLSGGTAQVLDDIMPAAGAGIGHLFGDAWRGVRGEATSRDKDKKVVSPTPAIHQIISPPILPAAPELPPLARPIRKRAKPQKVS